MRKIVINVKEDVTKNVCNVIISIKDSKNVTVNEMKTAYILYGKIQKLLKMNQI